MKRVTLIGIVFASLVICASGKILYDYQMLKLKIAFAEEQTSMFDEIKGKALQSNPYDAIEYLKYIITYYPSGTKQIRGSKLDVIVEKARKNVINEIIADLRKKTSNDFGENPQDWIERINKNDEEEKDKSKK